MKIFLSILGVVVLGLGAVQIVKFSRSIDFTEHYSPAQPIKFSHKVHAGDNQIACVYCHYSAEQGRHAGIPPVDLCMNCHTHVKKDSPEVKKITAALEKGESIRWQKVHHLPDFAYFNHSQHVNVGKVSCQQCHGEIQTQDRVKQTGNLSMGWCIDCHRQKEIAPPADHKTRAGGDCAKCHY